ncbi:MAG: DUF1688 family protein [Bdellovibrionales bacterium]
MDVVSEYLNPAAVRRTTDLVVKYVEAGNSNFNLNLDKLDACADLVVETVKDKYPELNIPYHSRWGHFRAGRPDRLASFFKEIESFDSIEQARIQFDLVIPSVLLDAGAGPDWLYTEPDGFKVGRSEGLGIASFYMFKSGAFSGDTSKKYRSDILGLSAVEEKLVGEFFQVSVNNPLFGLEGRANLVRALADCMESNKEIFPNGRIGDLVDFLLQEHGKEIPSNKIVELILVAFGKIWPGRLEVDGYNLGDVWHHKALDENIVFHKLSQWLSYSLFEPLESCGITIVEPDSMTGLAEYRNGGLFVDSGVIALKDSSLYQIKHEPSSDLIIEWRALTIYLLDKIAPIVREKLGLSKEQFPLAKVLEGGTWWTGRSLAKKYREDSSPPIKIESDGTVF